MEINAVHLEGLYGRGDGGQRCGGQADASPLRVQNSTTMAPQHLVALYNRLLRAFDARPSDLKTCGAVLAQLKVSIFFLTSLVSQHQLISRQVGLMDAGLLIPSRKLGLEDLVMTRGSIPLSCGTACCIAPIQAIYSRLVLSGAYGPKTFPRSTDTFPNCNHSIPITGEILLLSFCYIHHGIFYSVPYCLHPSENTRFEA